MITKHFKRYKYYIASLLFALLCIFYYFANPTQYSIMPKCPVKLMTSLDCPGCGFQRALHALLHGRVVEAIHYNLFLIAAIPLTLAWWIINKYVYNKRIPQKYLHINSFIIYFYICCYFAWFVIRNIY